MDFLNQFYNQLRDLFASMTPAARVTTGALLAVVVVSFGLLFKTSTSGPGEMLYGGEPLTRQEIIDIQGSLSQAGLSDFETVGNMIRVPRGQKHLYLAAIADAGAAPKSVKGYLDDAIKSLSPLSDSETRKQQFRAAREKELSHIISQMAWVQSASVMYDEKEVRGPRRSTIASATVNVMPKTGEGVDTRRRRNLQQLVAGSFATMKPDQVQVSDLSGGELAGDSSVSPDDFKTRYLEEKARVEQSVRREVFEHLSYIPGVRVQVNAELDEKLSERTVTTKPEPKAVPIRSISTSEKTSSQNIDGGARPGAVSNGPRGIQPDQVAERSNSATTQRDVTEEEFISYSGTTETEMAGLVPKAIWASIQVPMDYVVGLWKQRKIATEGKAPDLIDEEDVRLVKNEVIENIENAIKPLMPQLEAGQNEYEQVKVVVYDSLPQAEIAPPTAVDNALFWAGEHANSLAMAGLALVSLVMLRSMVRSSGKEPPVGGPSLQLETPPGSEATASADDVDEEGRPKLKLKKPDTVKDDLADMVREDPDAAAAILSNWISSAS